jgi:hypothetical protein
MKLRITVLLGAITATAIAFFAWEGPSRETYMEPVSRAAVADLAGTALSAPISSSQEEPDGCTIITRYLPNDDGTVTETYSCEPNSYQAKHPYESYSNQALVSLAYSEAKAAEILSIRLRDRDEVSAMSLAFRASALSGGDTHPILLYSQSYPHPSAINGVPIKKTYRDKYVMSAVALMLGDDHTGLPTWEAHIREFSEDPERELALLDDRARQILDEMRQIQLDITGDTTIGG